MAKYLIDTELLEKASEIKGKSVQEVAKMVGLTVDYNGAIVAWNRSEEHKGICGLEKIISDKKAADDKAAYLEKVKTTATWKKDGGFWMVYITGEKVEKGTEVDVERKDGSKQKVMIGLSKATVGGRLYTFMNI